VLNAVKAEMSPAQQETPSVTTAEAAPAAAPEPAPVPEPQPNPELRKGLQCLHFKPFDLQTGVKEDYKVKIGMATETRGGFIKREKAELSDGCFLPVLKPNQCAHMLVNQAEVDPVW
jgi:hypothetical protein